MQRHRGNLSARGSAPQRKNVKNWLFGLGRRPRTSFSHSRKRYRQSFRTPLFEQLEARQMLAVTPLNVHVYDGTNNTIATADAARGSSVTGPPTNPIGQNAQPSTLLLADIGSSGTGKYAGSAPVPAPGGGDTYAVFITGTIKIDNTNNPRNTWTFGTFADDASRIRIDLDQDGILEGDLNAVGGIANETVAFSSTANVLALGPEIYIPNGKYKIELVYTEGTGGDFGEFFYAPGIPAFSTTDYALIGDARLGISLDLNSAPKITNLDNDVGNSGARVSPGPQVLLDAGIPATISDPDVLMSGNFNGATLTIETILGTEMEDEVQPATNGGGNVRAFGTTTVGSFTGGKLGNKLEITFNTNATPAAVSNVLQNIRFSNGNLVLPANPSRIFAWTFDDGQGGAATVNTAMRVLAGDNVQTTRVWDGSSDGDGDGISWNDPLNWQSHIVPDADDIARFTGLDPGDVNLGGFRAVGEIEFTGGNYNILGGTLDAELVDHDAGNNTISAKLQGALTKIEVGGGVLTVSNLANPLFGASKVTVDNANGGGLLRAVADKGLFALGDADIVLDNGNLEIIGVTTDTNNAIAHYGYHINDDAVVMDLNNNGGMLNGFNPTKFQNFFGRSTLTAGPGSRGLDFDNDADFVATGAIGQNDNYSNLFLTTLRVPASMAGTWTFTVDVDDDPGGIWIDLNRNGVFESSTPGLGSDRNEQLVWNQENAVKTVILAAGDYLMGFTHREGAGGSQIDIDFSSPTLSNRTIQPLQAAQADLWHIVEYLGGGELNNDFTVSGASAVTLTNVPEISFSDLSVAASAALTVNSGTSLQGTLDFRGDGTGVVLAGSGDALRDPLTVGSSDPDTLLDARNGSTLKLRRVITPDSPDVQINPTGNGSVVLTSNNLLSFPAYFVVNGTLEAQADRALGEFPFTVVDGGTLRLNRVNLPTGFPVYLRGGSLTSTGNSSVDGIDLDADASIISESGTLTINTAINTIDDDPIDRYQGFFDAIPDGTGYEAVFDGDGAIVVNAVIGGGATIGTDRVRREGNGTAIFNAANLYIGETTINNGVIALAGAGTLGTSAGDTVVNSGATLRLDGGINIPAAEQVTIHGGGEATQGALRNETGNNTVNTLVLGNSPRIESETGTITVPTNLSVSSTLTVAGTSGLTVLSGVISGGSDITKFENSTLRLTNGGNNFSGKMIVNDGIVEVTASGALGTMAGDTTVVSGASLQFNGAFNYTVGETINISGDGEGGIGAISNIGGATTLSNVTINVTGTTITNNDPNNKLTIDETVTLNLNHDTTLIFDGVGDIDVKTNFGNGGVPKDFPGIAHFGYHINNDALTMNLNNNGGMLNGGNPTGFQNFVNTSLLTSGPGNRGLDFDSDADFTNTGNISLTDNYSNLFLTEFTAPADGLYEFRLETRDDVGGIWLDANQNGIFESGGVIDIADNYSNLFVGFLTVSAANAGNWTFKLANEDDSSGFWIDLNQNGVFNSTGALGDFLNEQITYDDTTARTVNLPAGQYMIAVTHRESTSGSFIDMQFSNPSTHTTLTTINPINPTQTALWSFGLDGTGKISLANAVAGQLGHYGFHINNDALALNLNNNGGMMGGGNPTTFQKFNGAGLLLGGPQGRGLDFNDDTDFGHTLPTIAYAGNYNAVATGTHGEFLTWSDQRFISHFLKAGTYQMAFTHKEGTGSSTFDVNIRVRDAAGATTLSERTIQPLDPEQAGFWKFAVVPNNAVIKRGTGTTTLFGNNSYNGLTTVETGTLIAAHANALGTTTLSLGTTVASGATLGLSGGVTILGEAITLNGTGDVLNNRPGALVNISGNNTIDVSSSIKAELFKLAGFGIGALDDPGTGFVDMLTINADIDMQFSKLTFDGAGNILVSGDISGNGSGIEVLANGLRAERYSGGGNNLDFDIKGGGNFTIDSDGSFSQTAGLLNSTPSHAGGVFNFGAMRFQDNRQGQTAAPFAWSANFSGTITGQPNQGIPNAADNFQFVWTGYFTPDVTGDYLFRSNSQSGTGNPDDHASLFLDQNLKFVFDDGGFNSVNTANVTYTNLQAGTKYPIILGFNEGTGSDNVSFRVAGPATSAIPTETYINPVTQSGFFQFRAGISDNSVMKSGGGAVTLRGNNTYSGHTTVMGGTLVVASDTALGSTAAGTTVVNGATLALDNSNLGFDGGANPGNVSIAAGETITLGGETGTSPPTLQNISGDNTVSGPITANALATSGARILSSSAAAGHKLTFDGTVDLQAPALIVDGAGNTVIRGVISESAAGRVVTKSGSGTLNLTAANTYTGDTTVSAGTLDVDGAIARVVVNTSATLTGNGSVGNGTANALNGKIVVSAGETLTINQNTTVELGPFNIINGTLNVTSGRVELSAGDNLSGNGTVNAVVNTFTPLSGAVVKDNATAIQVNTSGALVAAVNFRPTVALNAVKDDSSGILVNNTGTLTAAVNFSDANANNNGVTFNGTTALSAANVGPGAISYSLASSGSVAVDTSSTSDNLFLDKATAGAAGQTLTLSVGNLDPNKTYTVEVLHGNDPPALGGVDTTALQLWLDAGNLSSIVAADGSLNDGDLISAWNDVLIGANTVSNNAVQALAAKQPKWVASSVGGRPAVRFEPNPTADDETNGDDLLASGLSLGNNATFFFVVQHAAQSTAPTSCCRPFFIGDGDMVSTDHYSFSLQQPNNGPTLFRIDHPTGSPVSPKTYSIVNPPGDGSFHVYSFTRNGTVASGAQLFQDGAGNTPFTISGNATETTYNIGGQNNSTAGGGGRQYTGDISEIIAFNRTLSVAERQAVEAYLNSKYGLNSGSGSGGLGSQIDVSLQGAISGNSTSVSDLQVELFSNARRATEFTLRGETGFNYIVSPDAGIASISGFQVREIADVVTQNGVPFNSHSTISGTEGGLNYSLTGAGTIKAVDTSIVSSSDPLFFETAQFTPASTQPVTLDVTGLDPTKTYTVEVLHSGLAPNIGGIDQTGLVLWLDASNTSNIVAVDGTLDSGDLISAWNDTLTVGNTVAQNAVQTTAALQPVWQQSVAGLGGKSAIFFDGLASTTTGDVLEIASLGFGDNVSMFFVFQKAVQQNNTGSCCRPVFTGATGIGAGGTGYGFGPVRSDIGGGDDIRADFPDPGDINLTVDELAGGDDNTFHVWSLVRDGFAVNGAVIREEGTIIGSQTVSTTALDGLGNPRDTIYNIGGQKNNAARHYAGGIAEIIAFDRTLSDTERQAVEQYLAAKYGLPGGGTLPGIGQFDVSVQGAATGAALAVNDLLIGGDPNFLNDPGLKKTVSFTISGETGFTYTVTPDSGVQASIAGFQVREVAGSGGGTVSPGDDLNGDMKGDAPGEIGILSTGSISFIPSSTLDIDFAATGYDQLNATGSVNLNNARLVLNGTGVPPIVPPGGFAFVNNDGMDPVQGFFTDALGDTILDGQSVLVGGEPLEIRYNFDGNNDVVLVEDPDPVINTDAFGDDVHDDIIVRRKPGNPLLLQVLIDNVNAPIVAGVPIGYEVLLESTFTNRTSLTLNTGQGSDRVTIDFTYGNPVPILIPGFATQGIIYNGGEGGYNAPANSNPAANPHGINTGDRLRLQGIDPTSTFATESYWFGTTDIVGEPNRNDPEAGTVVLSGTQTTQITFDNIGDGDAFPGNVQRILDTYAVSNLRVVGNASDNFITLTDNLPNNSTDFTSLLRAASDLFGSPGVIDASDPVFSEIEFSNKTNTLTVLGMAGNDTLEVRASEQKGITVDGGSGTDQLIVSTLATPITVLLTGTGATDGWAGRYKDSATDNLISPFTPRELVQSGSFTNINNLVYIDGNNGTGKGNRIVAPSGTGNAVTFRIDGTNSGRVTHDGSGKNATFTGFENLDGGDQNDRFEIRDGGSLSGMINGDNDDNNFDGNPTAAELSDPGVDTLDYTGYSSSVWVNLTAVAYTDPTGRVATALPANSATAIFGGNAGGIKARGVGSSIENVFGGNADDLIRGDADNNTLGDGPGSDTLDGNAGNDVFSLSPGGVLGGAGASEDHLIDISGQDTIDFSSVTATNGYTGGVMIDMDLVSPVSPPSGWLGQDVLGGSAGGQNVYLHSNGPILPSPFENINGSAFPDMIWMQALAIGGDDLDGVPGLPIIQNGSPVLRNVNGGLPLIGADDAVNGDVLFYDGQGQSVKDTGSSLTTTGIGAVTYQSVVIKVYNHAAHVIDNGDVGFVATGTFSAADCFSTGISCESALALQARSVGKDLVFAPKAPAGGPATASATWTFDGLTPGRQYVVSMAWPQHDSLATNAPVTISDGTVLLTQIALDQKSGANDYRLDGVDWEILGRFTVTSGRLVVKIANNGNGQIFADAVRVEEINTQPVAAGMNAELRVILDDKQEIRDGQDVIQMTASIGGAVSRTVTVANIGTDNLLIYGIELVDGSGYTLSGATGPGTLLAATSALPAVIAPGLSRTFTVHLNSTTNGDKVDRIIIHSNDMDEYVAQKPGATGISHAVLGSAMDVDPFTIDLRGSVSSVLIIDDEDPGYTSGGFTEFGVDVGNPAQGYHGDLEYSKVGNGTDKAFWEFKNLMPGATYKVSVTWYPDTNRATDAPFTVLNGNRFTGGAFAGGQFSINQQLSPKTATASSTFDAGVFFADLGTFVVMGTTLTVRLTDAGNDKTKYVIADAVRLEKYEIEPDIRVESGTEVLDDTGVVTFGTIFPNQAGVVRTFTVTNVGATGDITLGPTISLPSGFSLVPGSGTLNTGSGANPVPTLFDGATTTVLAPGAVATFDLRMVGSSPGQLGGEVSFAAAGDADENPFNFTIRGAISSQRIIDNSTPTTAAERTNLADTYTETGTWAGPDGDGYLNDDRWASSSGNAASAVWKFNNLPAGQYEVFVTHAEEPIQGGAKAAPFDVFNGSAATGTLLGTTTVNQTKAPAGIHADGVNWQKLNGAYSIASSGLGTDDGMLTVRLTNPASANGFVHADGVMIRRLEGPEIAVFDLGADGLPGGSGANADVELQNGGKINFGSQIAATPGGGFVERKFEIRNLGNRTLGLGDPILALLNRFSVPVPNGGDFSPVAVGGSLPFTIRLNTAQAGIYSEQLSFATDDADEANFTLSLDAAVGSAIIDNTDPGYSQTGTWVKELGNGFGGEVRYNQNVGGPVETAKWNFTSVAPGRYQVIATWPQQLNLATNARYTISGNVTAAPTYSLTPTVDQKTGPNDLTLLGASWELLALVDVSGGGNVMVELTSANANNFVFADAVALIPLSGPQIVVTDLGADEAVGGTGANADIVLNGSQTLSFNGTNSTRTIQIRNLGNVALDVNLAHLLPAGFVNHGPFAFPGSVAADSVATFQLQFTGTTPGTIGGQVSLDTNDADNDPFNFQVTGTVAQVVRIIDNKDAVPKFTQSGFTEFGLFTNQVSQGFKDTLHYSLGGNGSDVATWKFTGLQSGVIYQVSATWFPHANRATNAPFSLYDGLATGPAASTVRVNQQLTPNDFSDQGVGWKNLGGVIVTGSTLTVTLSDAIGNSNLYVIADAIRIEPVITPEIEVAWVGPDGVANSGDEVAIGDGGAFDFGETLWHVPVRRTFQVRNAGGGSLDLSNLVAGGNFTVISGFSATSISLGDMPATFTVEFNAAALGNSAGQLMFDNNDPDENPFNFALTGRVTQGGAKVIDNGNAGWTGAGFTKFSPQGFADKSDGINDIHYSQVGAGRTATWQFTNLVPGTYRVSVTYPEHSNRATASPFTVYDSNGTSVLATTYVNQQFAPNDFGDLGAMWEDLTGGVTITGTTLTVKLRDNAPGQSGTRYVIADTVRIEKLENAPEIEVRDGTSATDPNVPSGTTIKLGSFFEGSTATRDLLIRNTGSATLHINPPTGANGITIVSDDVNGMPGVPAFTIYPDPNPINGNGEIAAGASSNFQVLFNAAVAGTYTATVTILSDDMDEGSFTINLTAAATSDVMIIDNGDVGFVASQFTRFGPPSNPAQGFQSDLHYHAPAVGSNKATWTFDNLPNGMYQVAVTWYPDPNRASNAPFRVLDGTVQETQVNINQRLAPTADVTVGTTKFQQIGTILDITNGKIVVELGTTATGYVIADAVRIERMGPLQAGVAESDGTAFLQEADVSLVLGKAISAWTAVDPSAAARLAGVDVRLEDLPGSVLGLASEYQNRIWLDINAAGHGWDVSGQSGTSAARLRSSSGSQLPALSSPLSFDLLTVVTHELGHLLGLPDLDPLDHSNHIMAGRLEPGARRSPLGAAVESAIEPAVADRAMAGIADRTFTDLGHFESLSGGRSAGLFENRVARFEHRGPAWLTRRWPADVALDAALRIDDEDAELTAPRQDDIELVDRLFSQLFDEDGEQSDEIL